MDALTSWISQYGYAGLTALLMLGIVGLPIPDETLLVFSGFLIFRHRLHPAPTFVAALLGAYSGITVSYLLGKILGRPLVDRYGKYVHLTHARLDSIEAWFERTGDWLLAVGYFIPGVRHFTALTAGISGLPFLRFGLFAYSGGAIWVAFFLALGYFVGDQWEPAMKVVHRYTWFCVAGLAAIALVIFLLRRSGRASPSHQ